MTVLVDLSAALICFAAQCFPALVGPDTPRGEYTITLRQVLSPGYGGDVLAYKEDDKYVWAIHRVWLGSPKQRRLERLQSGDVKQRVTVTNGCVNVMPQVYDMLVECCRGAKLIIK